MILLRMKTPNARLAEFARDLQAASGLKVVPFVDERNQTSNLDAPDKISLTDHNCRALGLYLSKNYPWRCGDYGYYLARNKFPHVDFFWMIEFDVRILGNMKSFFSRFEASRADLLAVSLKRAAPEWFWSRYALGRDIKPYQCLFPVSRLSRQAIDHLLALRLKLAGQGNRRALWPNDEAFVATSMCNSELVCKDFNDLGAPVYDISTFSHSGAINGEDAASKTVWDCQMMHPVLFGDDYQAKLKRNISDTHQPLAGRLLRTTLAPLNARLKWMT